MQSLFLLCCDCSLIIPKIFSSCQHVFKNIFHPGTTRIIFHCNKTEYLFKIVISHDKQKNTYVSSMVQKVVAKYSLYISLQLFYYLLQTHYRMWTSQIFAIFCVETCGYLKFSHFFEISTSFNIDLHIPLSIWL